MRTRAAWLALVRCKARVLLAVFLVMCDRRAAADQGPDKALAEALFQEARHLMEQHRAAEACPKFADSQHLVPKLGTLLNLAMCHELTGKTATAWAEFLQAAGLAQKAGEDARVRFARERAEQLEHRLSRLTFDVKSEVDGVNISVNGVVLGRSAWGLPVPVDPGDVYVQATAPGKRSWSTRVRVTEGPILIRVEVPPLDGAPRSRGADEDARMHAAPDAGRSTPAAVADGGRTQRAFGIVAAGVGVVGLGIGAVFGVRTFAKMDGSTGHCQDIYCDSEGIELRKDASTSATISTVAFAVGAAGVGAGILLYVTARRANSTPATVACVALPRPSIAATW